MGADMDEPERAVLLQAHRHEDGIEDGDANDDGQNPTRH
jgi:hypothetical protein